MNRFLLSFVIIAVFSISALPAMAQHDTPTIGAVVTKTENKIEKAVTTTKKVVKADAQKVAKGTKKVAKKVGTKSVEAKDVVVKKAKAVGASTKKVKANTLKTTQKAVQKTERTLDKMGTDTKVQSE